MCMGETSEFCDGRHGRHGHVNETEEQCKLRKLTCASKGNPYQKHKNFCAQYHPWRFLQSKQPKATMSVPTVPDADTTADLLSFAKDLAQSAGALIREAFAKERGDYDCKSATDPVTETDHAVEAHIFGRIRERFPKHSLIGEESASDTEWTNAPTWIIDPIDGTANCEFVFFLNRFPCVCAYSCV